MFKLICVSAVFVATAAVAQAPTDVPERSGPNNDPNQRICRNEPVLGSRVNRMRICKTRAEWADSRNQERRDVEKAQTNRPSNGR